MINFYPLPIGNTGALEADFLFSFSLFLAVCQASEHGLVNILFTLFKFIYNFQYLNMITFYNKKYGSRSKAVNKMHLTKINKYILLFYYYFVC
jgi:hypothetical protein